MGFDIECIIDIHTYPGEYFCPVCRTLVFPNEAVQSQCTHLYCKPCLAHVANGSRACPYDGYLVSEADSKPLIESDKTLAESIGRVKVRCLYHRSGCTWEGSLSDCTSHCSGCSFGNSPVICNRCGVQIVHQQVHEHALSCPGVYPAQQTANGAQDNPSSGAATTAVGADSNQTTAPSGTPASQTPNAQTTSASLLPGQDPKQQTNASSQALAIATAGVPTSEQWYQQQYQQYYQQYAGYDPYQQYYPYQQQPIQQYQQQPQIYMQPPAQPQTPFPAQPQSQTPVPAQPQSQTPVPAQAQSQSLPQPQPLNPQSQLQMQAPPKGQTQPQVQAQGQQHQNQVQVNRQQQLPPTMQPHTQIPSQIYPTSRAHPPTQPPPYPQPYPMQPHSQHLVQVPQYQQPPAQVHPSLSSQAQSHPPVQPQPHSQLQPQINVQHHPPSHGQLPPPQAGQPAHALGQTLHSTVNAVSGFHSYPQPQPMQQAPMGMTQQPPMRPHPTSGSMPPVQTHGQVPQQPPLVRPPQGIVSNQQPVLVPSQGQAPAQSQIYPTAQQAGHSIQQHPVQPNQQPMSQQYSQQHTFPGPFPSQSHQQGQFTQQQPLQSQFRPQGLPNVVPQSSHAYIQPQQNVTLPPPPQPQQSQTYTGRLGMQNHVQSISQAHGGYNITAQVRPVQPSLGQPQMNPSYGNHMSNEHELMDQKKRSALESKGDLLPDKTAGRPEVGVPSQDNAQEDLSSLAAKSIDAVAPRFEADLDDEQQKRRKAIDEYRQRASSDIDVHKGDSDDIMDKRTVKEEGNEKILFGQPRSMESARDKRLKAPMGEHLSPLQVPHDQASRPLDRPPRGFGYDSGSKFEASAGVLPNRLLPPYHPPGSMHFKDSGEREAPLGPHDNDRKRGGSGFGVHHMDYLSARNPDGEFLNIPPRGFVSRVGFEDIGGREPHQFIEGPGPFNLPSNLAGGLYSDGRFQTLPGHSHGGEIDGLGDLKGGEHNTFGRPYKHVRSGDLFGKDIPSHLHHGEPLDPQQLPRHLRFGEPAGFGPFAGRAFMGQLSTFGDIPGFGESIGRNKPGMPRFGEPGFRSRYTVPGYPNHELFAGDVDSFDRPRKRKPVSMGWCRICKVDCETVEGLDMHSQTREHQDMAIDMVRSIKEQNRKKQKTFNDRASIEERGKTRKAVFEGRGRKF